LGKQTINYNHSQTTADVKKTSISDRK